jgi:hypothetical protein
MGKKARAKAARRKRREDPNPERSGKAKNVKTEVNQMDELKCWKGYTRVKGVPAGAPFSCKKENRRIYYGKSYMPNLRWRTCIRNAHE